MTGRLAGSRMGWRSRSSSNQQRPVIGQNQSRRHLPENQQQPNKKGQTTTWTAKATLKAGHCRRYDNVSGASMLQVQDPPSPSLQVNQLTSLSIPCRPPRPGNPLRPYCKTCVLSLILLWSIFQKLLIFFYYCKLYLILIFLIFFLITLILKPNLT